MHQFQIEPHVGIGPIRLGASREEIRAALLSVGFPLKHTRRALDYFCNSSIQVEFGDDDCADFIGCAYHAAYTLSYRGANVFDTIAKDLFTLIAENDGSGIHTFKDSGYCFPNQIVTLWDADTQYDRLGGEQRPIWGQVGLGNQRYLDAIRQIRSRGE